MITKKEVGYLCLESGESYPGLFCGSSVERAGEVVFNTSHSGYEEIATDPSYFSQIVVMTAPMQGNYGVDQKFWESQKLWIEGFVCVQAQSSIRDRTWLDRLKEHKIPCLSDLDTRQIVIRLRSGGTPWGAIVTASNSQEAMAKASVLIDKQKTISRDWVYQVTRQSVEIRKGQNETGPKIAILDFGAKENILRELAERSRELVIFPSRTSALDIVNTQCDGLMLSNGPGDPADVQIATATVRDLLGQMPIFGICMGHQILGLAIGAKTYKMKFGHRGANHPIQDSLLKKIYMTSQNHGYAVEASSLPNDALVTHRNLNDQTVAGFYNDKQNYLGIQYHPESHPGPHEASGLFDFFIKQMIAKGKL